MTAKKKKELQQGVLYSEMNRLMTPEAMEELKGLSPTMQQFLLRWQDQRDEILGEKLKEELKDFLFDIYEKDNDTICANIAEIVSAQNRNMFQALSQQNKSISDIALSVKNIEGSVRGIQLDVANIKGRLTIIEDKQLEDEDKIQQLQKCMEAKGDEITTLKQKVEVLQPDRVETLITELENLLPIVQRFTRYSSTWNTALRIAFALSVGWLVTYLALHFIFRLI